MGDEKKIVQDLSIKKQNKSAFQRSNRELDAKKGFFAELTGREHCNCWLFGFGSAKYLLEEFCLAYVSLKDEQEERATQDKNENHLHELSEEWYFTFQGSQELQVNDQKIKIPSGYLLRIGAGVSHKISVRQYPFEGMVVRAPLTRDDKIVLVKS